VVVLGGPFPDRGDWVRSLPGRARNPRPQAQTAASRVEAPPAARRRGGARALSALEKQGFLSQGKFKPHYFGVFRDFEDLHRGRLPLRRAGVDELGDHRCPGCENGRHDGVLREIEEVFARPTSSSSPIMCRKLGGALLLDRSRKRCFKTRRLRMEITPNAS